MWPDRDRMEVECIACGETLARSRAREYDKHGDRWDRENKEFEYLCKPCYRDLCHQPRLGLESTLAAVDAGSLSQPEFLERYHDAIEGETEQDGSNEHGSER